MKDIDMNFHLNMDVFFGEVELLSYLSYKTMYLKNYMSVILALWGWNKSLSRRHVWWPNLDNELEELVNKCSSCQANRHKPPAAPLHPWSWPTRVWQRIHIDFVGPFLGQMFFLIIDAYSKWLEIFLMYPIKHQNIKITIYKVWSARSNYIW